MGKAFLQATILPLELYTHRPYCADTIHPTAVVVPKDSALPQPYSSKTKALWYRDHLMMLLQ